MNGWSGKHCRSLRNQRTGKMRTKLQLNVASRSDEADSAIIVLETQADFRSRHKKGRHEWHPSGSENQY
jgi:hypothetical protein